MRICKKYAQNMQEYAIYALMNLYAEYARICTPHIWKVGSCDIPTMTGIYQSWLVYHKWYIPILVI
jgi:hypothetical protein